MSQPREPSTLADVLDVVACAGGPENVCVADLLKTFGQRSFGALLLVPSLIVVSPISGIPGVPTVTGVLISLIAIQMLLGRTTLWLPRSLLQRCIARRQLDRVIAFVRPGAAIADRLLEPRLMFLTQAPFNRLIAATCLATALTMPALEVVPFATSIVAAAIAVFALALIAHDGLLVVVAFLVAGASLYFGLGALL